MNCFFRMLGFAMFVGGLAGVAIGVMGLPCFLDVYSKFHAGVVIAISGAVSLMGCGFLNEGDESGQ